MPDINLLSLLREEKIVPFIIEDEYKMFYYRGLREFEKIQGYLTDTCLSAQVIQGIARHFTRR